VLAVLCRPDTSAKRPARHRAIAVLAVVLLLCVVLPRLVFGWMPNEFMVRYANNIILGIAIFGVILTLFDRAANAAITIAAALAALWLYPPDELRVQTIRSFFGVHKVYESRDGKYRVLMHGTTIHGAQRLRTDDGKAPEGRPEPLTYYNVDSPMAETIRAVRARKGAPLEVAVIGLGAGTLSCQSQPGDTWRFFEIDPSVVEIARDASRFTYLRDCAPTATVVIGDARLTLVREADRRFDVIVVDAYSSDAIPIHLATREAMAIYKAKLAPNGAIVMHISNRYLELESVVAGIAQANGLKTWNFDGEEPNADDDKFIFSSSVVIAAARPESIGALASSKNWSTLEPDSEQRVWTDDYSNVFGVMRLGIGWPEFLKSGSKGK
jgi:predicted membrane-bound spermidine synthase